MRRRAGVTIIELLIVMGVIGVLAGLVTPAVMSVRQTSTINASITSIRALEVAISSDCAKLGKCGDYRFRGVNAVNRTVPDMLRQYLPAGFKMPQDTNTYALQLETYIFGSVSNNAYPLCLSACMARLLQPTWNQDTLGFTNSAGFSAPPTIWVWISLITRNPDVAQSVFSRIGGSPPVFISNRNVWKVTYPVLLGVPATG